FATYSKIYALQDADCTPVHFSYVEMNYRTSDWTGGAVSPAKARSNALRGMRQLERLPHQPGDDPPIVASGFRSYRCHTGAHNSPAAETAGTAALTGLLIGYLRPSAGRHPSDRTTGSATTRGYSGRAAATSEPRSFGTSTPSGARRPEAVRRW